MMSTSKNREKSNESPSKSDESGTEKPKSSPARRMVLVLLLVATIVVVGLDYLPEGDSESEVVGPPAKKMKPTVESPVRPQQQQPAAPKRTQPAPVPTPPQYEKPPETLFVSNSPSDMSVPVPSPAETAMADVTPPASVPAPEPVAPAETAPAEPGPTEAVAATASAKTEPAVPAAETVPEATVAETPVAADTPTPAAEPAPEQAVATAPGAPPTEPTSAAVGASASSPELVATRSPAPSTLPIQADSELVIVVENLRSPSKSVARPLPDGIVPAKVNRYARRLFDRHDTNGDGVIDATEWRRMKGNPMAMDFNADGKITLEELAAYTADFGRHRRMRLTGSMVEEAVAELPPLYIPTAERDAIAAAQQAEAVPVALVGETVEVDMEPTVNSEGEEEGDDTDETAEPEQPQPANDQVSSKRFVTPKSRLAGVPEWFLTKDANGDGQLTVSEYAPDSHKARLTEFARFDRNNDGVLTAQECPKQ